MSRRLERDIEAWLQAEAAASDSHAEDALGRVFRGIERRRPRAGFADAVLAAAGYRPARAAAAPWFRVALVGCVVAACLTAVAVPLALIAVKPLAQLAAWPLLAAAWRGVTRSASAALNWWAVVGDLGGALRLSVATPTGASLVLANVLIASASLVGLKRLLGNTRSFSNAS